MNASHTWARLGPGFQSVLTEMCARVRSVPGDIDWSDGDWYLTRRWSEPDQDSFVGWLTEALHADRKLRAEILTHPRKTKAHCRKAAREFVFMWGWGIQ